MIHHKFERRGRVRRRVTVRQHDARMAGRRAAGSAREPGKAIG